jgi:2-dehydropantoate 2-reductase
VRRVAVFGAGAVGSYLGSRLAKAGAEVHLIARGDHLEAIRERGLTLVTPEGSETFALAATDDPAGIGPVDVVVFGVKSYDTESAAARLPPLIGDGTAVLSIQNSVMNETKIAAVVGEDHVLGAAAYILASIEAPGVVRSGPCRLVIGELRPGPPSERTRSLAALFEQGGVRAVAVDDVRVAKWEKYVLLVAFSAVSAGTQLPLGDIKRSLAAAEMLRGVMQEAFAVGRALGVPLAGDLVERQHRLVLAQDDSEGTSLRHDLLHGRRMEIDALQGALVRMGEETGIGTPWTKAAFAILEPWAIRNGTTTAG